MDGQDQGIQLGDGGDGGVMPMGPGGDGGPSYPSLTMSSDNPDMGEAPEEGSATIHFHKHSHTKERHPSKPGQHKHHVHLKVHSIKFHKRGGGKPRVSKSELEEALAGAGGGGPPEDGGEGASPVGA